MLQAVLSSAVLGSVYVLFALGLSLAWGTIGVLNLAHGSIFMFSSYATYRVALETSLPLPVLLLVSAAVGALLSAALEVAVFRPVLRRARDLKAAELQMVIGGIGVAGIPLALVQHETKSNPFGFREAGIAAHVHTIGDLRITDIQIVLVVLTVVLTTAVILWLERSRHGIALRAIGIDGETASLMGVNHKQLSLITLGVGGALAGLAGTLLTMNLTAITAESGETLLVKAFAVIILGGVGSVGGTVTCCYLLAVSETIVLRQTSGQWVDAVSFALILLVMVVRPRGIFGKAEVSRT